MKIASIILALIATSVAGIYGEEAAVSVEGDCQKALAQFLTLAQDREICKTNLIQLSNAMTEEDCPATDDVLLCGAYIEESFLVQRQLRDAITKCMCQDSTFFSQAFSTASGLQACSPTEFNPYILSLQTLYDVECPRIDLMARVLQEMAPAPAPSDSLELDALEDDDDEICFPGTATIQLQGGVTKALKDLQLGEKIAVVNADSSISYSDVIFFSQKNADKIAVFNTLVLEDGTEISATPNHYVPVFASQSAKMGDSTTVPMSDVSEGTFVMANGKIQSVVQKSAYKAEGVYAPHTLSGYLLIDGAAMSQYTTIVPKVVADAGLAVAKAGYMVFGATGMQLVNDIYINQHDNIAMLAKAATQVAKTA